jgi:fluoride exporter
MPSEQLSFKGPTAIGRKLAVRGGALSAAVAMIAASAQAADAYFWVAIGGAIGSMARHWSTAVGNVLFGAAFPWGTLLINIIGSFVIGFFFAITGPDGGFDAPLSARLFVMTGICGGYTTFSAFSLQTLTMFQDGAWLRGGGYVIASVVLCLIAVWLGHAAAAGFDAGSE